MVTSNPPLGGYILRPGFKYGGPLTLGDVPNQTMCQYGSFESSAASLERGTNGPGVLEAVRVLVIENGLDRKMPADPAVALVASGMVSAASGPIALRINVMTTGSISGASTRTAAALALLQLLADVDFTSYALSPQSSCPIASNDSGLWQNASGQILFRYFGGSTDMIARS